MVTRNPLKRAQPRLVVIGGGTGSFTILQSLKLLTPHITALVSMADDGGSTGVLRDELGVLPPGDIRQCLVALSDTPKLRELFTYRFGASSLEGHTLGNLFLTALEKLTGNFAEAVETASEVLNITGRVVPITLDNIRLQLDGPDGLHVEGEHRIEETSLSPHSRPQITLVPTPQLNPDAAAAIAAADLVVIAPGDIYTSLAPALVVPGVGTALQATKAKIVYVCNLVVKPGQTDGMSVADHAAEIERFAGAPIIDYVLYNTEKPAEPLVERYAADKEFLVPVDHAQFRGRHYRTIAAELVAGAAVEPSRADVLAANRSLIRHDAAAVSRQIKRILKKHIVL